MFSEIHQLLEQFHCVTVRGYDGLTLLRFVVNLVVQPKIVLIFQLWFCCRLEPLSAVLQS